MVIATVAVATPGFSSELTVQNVKTPRACLALTQKLFAGPARETSHVFGAAKLIIERVGFQSTGPSVMLVQFTFVSKSPVKPAALFPGD